LYVCLAGDGHLDYYDHHRQSATRPNHIPPIQDRIPYDASPSGTMVTLGLDNPLADLDEDGAPDLAIGRLPAQTAASLTAMINRIVTHEAGDAWKNKVLLVSDKDVDDAFGAARERLAAQVPAGISISRLGHTMSTPVDTMRNNFIQSLNSGAALAVYYGHANNIGISSPYFFEHSYVRSYMSSLNNAVQTPLFIAGTCMLNDFAPPHPDNRCLGKGLLDTAPGGAVAVWASAAEATLSMAEATTGAIFDELFASNDERLGDLIAPALDLQAHSASPWTVRASVLLGDPGTRIRTHLALDQTPPAIQITGPVAAATYTSSVDRLDLSGTASDANGILGVVVRNDRTPGEFVATGTTNWQRSNLVLSEGTNVITAIAVDSAGNSATATVRVVYVFGLKPWIFPSQMEMEDFNAGGQGVGYSDATAANEGGKYRPAEGVDIAQDATAGNGHVVGWVRAGEWLEYTVAVETSGTYTLETRIASMGVGGQIRFWVNGVDKTGALAVPNTGAWNKFQILQKTGVELAAGVHLVRISMVSAGTSGYVGIFDWFRATPAAPGPARMAYPAGAAWPLPGTVELEDFDIGGAGVTYSDTTAANEGGKYRTADGVDIAQDAAAGNGHVLGWVKAGEWLEYTVNVATSGTYALGARVASSGVGGQFRILVDGVDKTGALTLPNTGGWNKYQVVAKTGVDLVAGVQTVRVAMIAVGGSGYVGIFDQLSVSSSSGPAPGPARMAYPAGAAWPLPGTVELEDFDIGGAGVTYSDTTAANEGGKYRTADGVDIAQDAAAGNGHVLGWVKAGEWLEYTVNVATSGTYALGARVASSGVGGQFRILVDGVDKTGALTLPNTGGWNKYQVVAKTGVDLVAGVQTVRVAMIAVGGSGYVGIFDQLSVSSSSGPAPGPARMAYPAGAAWPLPGTVELEDFDIGGAGVTYSDTTAANEGGKYRTADGVDIAQDAAAGNGHVLGWVKAGEWLEYTVNVATSGTYALGARVASSGVGGQFRILVDGVDKTGALTLPNTGGWNKYQVVAKTGVDLVAGVQTVRVAMIAVGGSGYVGIFDQLSVSSSSGPAPGPARMAYPAGAAWPLPGTVELEDFDIGGAGVTYSDTTAANEGGKYRTADGVDIAASAGTGNGHVLGWVKAGEWLEYTVNVATSGTYTLETRVAALGAGGQIRILVNGEDKTGVLAIPNTGSWSSYQLASKTGVDLVAGVQTVRVAMVTAGASGYVGIFDWFRATAAVAPLRRSMAASTPLPEPVEVRTHDELEQPGAGWLAVDGDSKTVWQGTAVAGGGWLVLAYEDRVELNDLAIDWESAPPSGVRYLGSMDATTWTEIELPLTDGPVALHYLWILVSATDEGELPAIREIHVE
jgi:hypothetical protein